MLLQVFFLLRFAGELGRQVVDNSYRLLLPAFVHAGELLRYNHAEAHPMMHRTDLLPAKISQPMILSPLMQIMPTTLVSSPS